MRLFGCVVVMFICFVQGGLGAANLPEFLKVCPKSSPNLKQCLTESIESLRPLLAVGIPEFDIPKCEPLRIDKMVIDQGRGPVSVQSAYSNIQVFGAAQFTIRNVKVDLTKDRVKIKLFFPKLTVNSDYTMTGQILLMPITGSGPSYGNYSNIEAVIAMRATRVTKNDEEYYNVADCFIDFDIGEATLRFDNLFNGNQELGEAMNLFLNDNWKTVSDEIKPVLEAKLAELFKQFANKIFRKYPINVLFPN